MLKIPRLAYAYKGRRWLSVLTKGGGPGGDGHAFYLISGFQRVFWGAHRYHAIRIIQIPYRRKKEIELVFIFIFAVSAIRNSWTSPLAAATRTIPELVLFRESYISLYGIDLEKYFFSLMK